jgi:hypothetical protein
MIVAAHARQRVAGRVSAHFRDGAHRGASDHELERITFPAGAGRPRPRETAEAAAR